MSDKPSIDTVEFRKALGSFTTGVTVVTTRASSGEDVGLTANSFNSVSLDPPMVLWSLSKTSRNLSVFREAVYFAVHILSQDQEELSGRFARRGEDKFSGVALERGPNDVPLLPHSAARFICRTAYQYEGGDHIIFVGEVTDFLHDDLPPLLFHGGQYGQISKKNGLTGAEHHQSESRSSEHSLSYLLRLCYHQINRPLKEELLKRQITSPQFFFLSLAARYEKMNITQLLDMLTLGDTVITLDDIAILEQRGIIELADERVEFTLEGFQLHLELASIFKACESDGLDGLDYNMRQTLRILLEQLIDKSKDS